MRQLENDKDELHSYMRNLLFKLQESERKKTELSDEKGKLEKKLEQKIKTTQMFSNQVTTMESRVQELERKDTEQSIKLVKQLEDTRKAGMLFMNAADTYQEVAEKRFKEKVDELEDTRNAALLFMNAADMYEEEMEWKIKEKIEELEDTRKAALLFMSFADRYQEFAEGQIKEKVEELKVLEAQKAEMDERVESLESQLKIALAKNQEMEAVMVKKEYDLVKGQNDKLKSQILIVEHEHVLSEVVRLNMELGALAEVKETTN